MLLCHVTLGRQDPYSVGQRRPASGCNSAVGMLSGHLSPTTIHCVYANDQVSLKLPHLEVLSLWACNLSTLS